MENKSLSIFKETECVKCQKHHKWTKAIFFSKEDWIEKLKVCLCKEHREKFSLEIETGNAKQDWALLEISVDHYVKKN